MRLSLKDNCLSFALRRLNQEGGRLVCRRSGYSWKGDARLSRVCQW